MAKKKNSSANDIISMYMDFVLEHNKQPSTVYAFAKANNFEESKFYEFFGSFEAVEEHVFKAFFDNSLVVLEKSPEYQNFDPRNKLLSFYFTFFENLTANRSYVIYALKEQKNDMKRLKVLTKLKGAFTHYIANLGIDLIDIKQAQLDKIQTRGLKETAWLQLLLTMKFWMDDTSASFEKTDIFIEKSVNTSFDVLDVAPVRSLIDFGKFIFKERVKMK
ncbi:TetR/AcrR family transcriptional regulator [Subsaximicrobium wynnwilliamsii]|uniref:TetR/AcrR family transcriptional regulator n=1 Tax=Subsaximicrobium wynnwilliamsii TaxID=291179 RepID=A0A5C6ZBD5_9FLAO|nr:TetR family transcriptional regulator C-terminal domain-containing protein [Subsaximicrobium wynnwilliamsii]TXD81316.1 TetR/AcrR family transcriptional regulator [Subsaximicrobium wynnwilliamsii]TXD87315.1 TetR/AcrR family transcriptional regulator [Subsaximicrobium wynnwilliamsii]TXE00920.1 TetR/AcrR family transcriptional regulator [Subsaximicrobium wynnwilliamsii]